LVFAGVFIWHWQKKGGDPREEEEGIAATDDGAGRRKAPVVLAGPFSPDGVAAPSGRRRKAPPM